MKKLHEKFATRLMTFAIIMLAFLAVGTAMACSGTDITVFADSIMSSSIAGVSTASLPLWFVLKDNIKSFKVLSDEERKDFTDEESSKYLGALIKWQTKSIEDLNTQLAAKGDDADIKKQIKELTSVNMASMKSSLELMGTAVAKLTMEVEAKSSNEPLTMKAAILKSLHDNKTDVAQALKTANGSIELEIKALEVAGDIDAGTDFAEMESGVGQIATRKPFMRELFANKNTSKEYVKYNDQETIVRDAKNVAGCAASTHNSKITWKVRTMQITKVRDMVDICIDMMDDYDYVEGEMRGLLDTDVKLKIDSDLLLSDGVYPNPNSVDNIASTFAVGAYATSIQDAQLIDLIKIAGAQISDFGQNNKFSANYVLLNPIDACKMQLLKDLDGNYLVPNWITSDGVNIGSMTVIANQLVPANEAYVMDSTKGTVYARRGMTVQLAFENKDNFEKEIVTMKAYERLNFRVRNVDANAFMHIADITAAITAIDKP